MRSDAGKPKSHHKQKTKPDPGETQLIASTFCAALSGVAIALTNDPHTAINEGEKALIIPALVGTLESLSDDARQRVNSLTNPIMLLAGLGLWGLRVSGSLSNKPAGKPQPIPPLSTPVNPPAVPPSVDPRAEITGNAADQLQGRLGGDVS